jgi:hypothetical protein
MNLNMIVSFEVSLDYAQRIGDCFSRSLIPDGIKGRIDFDFLAIYECDNGSINSKKMKDYITMNLFLSSEVNDMPCDFGIHHS